MFLFRGLMASYSVETEYGSCACFSRPPQRW